MGPGLGVVTALGVIAAAALALCVAARPTSSSPWTRLVAETNGSFAGAPRARQGAHGSYCGAADSFLVWSGLTGDDGRFDDTDLRSDGWAYDFEESAWWPVSDSTTTRSSSSHAAAPRARVWGALVDVPLGSIASHVSLNTSCRCATLLYGGATQHPSQNDDLDDVWLLTWNRTARPRAFQGAWTPVPTSGVGDGTSSSPGARSQHAAVHRRGNVLVFGGCRSRPGSTTAFNDLWELTLSSPNGSIDATTTDGPRIHGTWARIVPSSTSAPRPRCAAAAALVAGGSASDDRLAVFSGRAVTAGSGWDALGDLWIFSFSSNTWAPVAGLAPERASAVGAAWSTKLFFFGGTRAGAPDAPYSFARRLALDQLLVTDVEGVSSSPVARRPGCVGSTSGETGLWCVSDSSAGSSTRPNARFDVAHATRLDRQLLVFGGRSETSVHGDLWALDLARASDRLAVTVRSPGSSSAVQPLVYVMATVLLVATASVIVFLLGSGFARRRPNPSPPAAAATTHDPVVGVSPAVIRALPIRRFRARPRIEAGRGGTRASGTASRDAVTTAVGDLREESGAHLNDTCAICLADFDDGCRVRELPCEHCFHPSCIDTWLRLRNACPMCKAVVEDDAVSA